MYKDKKRFQECNKIIQLWRYRWYLFIPFIFIYKIFIIKIKKNKLVKKNLKILWHITISDIQKYMNWWYTSEEVFSKIKKKN